MTKKNILTLVGILFLCGLSAFAVFFLPAWAGILTILILGVSIVLAFVLKRSDRLQNEQSFEIVPQGNNVNDLAAYLQRLREGEKATLSRELHDNLGQLLTALRMISPGSIAGFGRTSRRCGVKLMT
jgi:signal transduction histidine kinase